MDARRRWWRLSRAELLAAAAVFVATAPVVQPLAAQQASRMALTAAIAEEGTVRIDRSEDALGIDYAIKDGHLYSDKAPAQPVLAVGPYLLYKAVGGESAVELRVEENLGLWWISVWSAAFPLAVLVVVLSRLARPWSHRFALPAALAMAFGTILLPFGSVLFSHTASAALVAGAVLLWRRRPVAGRHLALAGFLLGCAVAVEYTTVAAVAVVGIASFVRDRWRAGWVALGTVPPLIGVMAYHWIAFGGPLEVPYRYHVQELHDSAVAGLKAPSLERLWTLISDVNGLFVLMPIVAIAVYGLGLAVRDHPGRRAETTVIAAVFASFVIIQLGANDLTGGDSLGPRYVIPGLAPLVIGLAVAWNRIPRACGVVAGVSAVFMALATYTNPLRVAGPGHWLELIADGDVADTVLDPVLGPASIVVVAGVAGLLALAAIRSDVPDRASTTC